MFESLSDKLSGIFDKLTRRGALSEANVAEALREVRRALLDADVALNVVRSFTDKVQARAVGANVVKSVSPGQMVIKIVNAPLKGSHAGAIAACRTHDDHVVTGDQITGHQPNQKSLAAALKSILKVPVLHQAPIGVLDIDDPMAMHLDALMD